MKEYLIGYYITFVINGKTFNDFDEMVVKANSREEAKQFFIANYKDRFGMEYYGIKEI